MLRLAGWVTLVMIAFAANSVLNRMALTGGETGPASFAVVRLIAGAVTLSLLVILQSGARRLGGEMNLRNAAALALYMLGFSFAYVTLDAGLGALIMFGGVQITMFLGSVLSGDAIPGRRWLGAGLAFAGLIWLLWPGSAAAPPFSGTVLMLLAAVGWGVYSLLGRGSKDPLAGTAGAFVLALPPAVIVWAALPDGLDPRGAVLGVIAGALTSGVGYALWYRVLPQLSASIAAVVQLTVPVIAMAGGMVFLGENLTLRFVIASVVVLGGVALAVTTPSAPKRPAEAPSEG